jgi:hypothetical protein
MASMDDKQEGAKLQEEKPDEQKQDKKSPEAQEKVKTDF